ncbi:hypothetical protein PsYK624_128700 [Phanerochaete sordida]|uniref:F-box domain-containing protein n=1 Tax=Phanerochaete sordida TaxID=48140 RepID=A0A9P3GKN2_9APHY|nr:hypothetical protein PsYK624_128700 [Phanerochaete sordida]
MCSETLPAAHPCATILDLPAEILDLIFVVHRDASKANSDCTSREAWAFLALEAVCKLWRDLVRANKLLWTRIALPAPAGHVMRALDRSGDLALDITLYAAGPAMDKPVCSDVLNALTRTRSIALAVSDSTPTCDLYSTSSCNAPHLETLNVGDNTGRLPRPPHILTSISAAPRLHTLDIFAYPSVWSDLARFTGLKTLAVRAPRLHTPATQTSISTLTAVLHALASLADLNLFCHVTDDTHDAAPVHLPRLRRLRLTGRAWCTAAVLRALAFPRAVRVRVGGTWAQPLGRIDFRDTYTSVVLTGAIPALTGGARIAALRLALTRDELAVAGFAHPAACAPRFVVRVSQEDLFLDGFLDALPLDELYTLAVTQHEDASRASAEWLAESLAGALARVRTLTLQGGGLAWLREVLAECAALHTLELVGHAFPGSCSCTPDGAKADCFHELERALAARYAGVGARLPELRLVRCNVPDGAKGLFVPYVEVLSEGGGDSE